MTIHNLFELFSDDTQLEIFSFEQEDTIFSGWASDLPDALRYSEIQCIDAIDHVYNSALVININ